MVNKYLKTTDSNMQMNRIIIKNEENKISNFMIKKEILTIKMNSLTKISDLNFKIKIFLENRIKNFKSDFTSLLQF